MNKPRAHGFKPITQKCTGCNKELTARQMTRVRGTYRCDPCVIDVMKNIFNEPL